MSDKDIWNDEEWIKRRSESNTYRRRYAGKHLDELLPGRDRDSGDAAKRFPLRLNLDKLACDIHRDITRGVPNDDDTLFVKSIIGRGEDPERAELIEDIINEGVWRPSSAGAIQQEALLSMNIYGGTAFKLSWEPWLFDLPYSLAVRPIKDPALINPKMDFLNPWRMTECYFGYEIDRDIAEAKYGIAPSSADKCLYMEHWTENAWKIQVDDQVPTIKFGNGQKVELQGENIFGFVPFYYIPHERTVEMYGESQAFGKDGLTREVNSRTVSISDLVASIKSDVLYGTDMRGTTGQFKMMSYEGQPMKLVLDLGDTKAMQNAKTPALHAIPMPDIPGNLVDWPMQLFSLWMMIERVSPAAFGLDDTSSGRITGPAISQRMWTSVAHCVTERTNFSTAKTMIDRDIIRMLANEQFKKDLELYGIDVPDINEKDARRKVKQNWPTMLPIDRAERHKELIEMLRERGMSIEEYVEERGKEDITRIRQEILDWQRDLAEVAPVNRPPMIANEKD